MKITQPRIEWSQKQRVLHLLQSKPIVWSNEFSDLKPKILNYTERIHELRDEWYNIKNERSYIKVGKRSMLISKWYYLWFEQPQEEKKKKKECKVFVAQAPQVNIPRYRRILNLFVLD